MLTFRYTVQTLSQTNEGGDPVGALMLAPFVEPSATAEGSPTSSRALTAAPTRASRQSIIPLTDIDLEALLAEGLTLGDTVMVTVSKEQV